MDGALESEGTRKRTREDANEQTRAREIDGDMMLARFHLSRWALYIALLCYGAAPNTRVLREKQERTTVASYTLMLHYERNLPRRIATRTSWI